MSYTRWFSSAGLSYICEAGILDAGGAEQLLPGRLDLQIIKNCLSVLVEETAIIYIL